MTEAGVFRPPSTVPTAMARLTRFMALLVVFWPMAALSQAEPDTDIPATPGIFEVARYHRALSESAGQARRSATAFADADDLIENASSLRLRQEDLRLLLENIAEAEYARPDRISRIRDQALQHAGRLETLRRQSLEQLEGLEAMQAEWLERRSWWQAWRRSAQQDDRFPAVRAEFDSALALIDGVLEIVGTAVPDVVRVREEVAILSEEAEVIAQQAAAIRAGRRANLTLRGEPFMFSRAFADQIATMPWREWRPMQELRQDAYGAFARANTGVFLFHLLTMIILAIVARRIQGMTITIGSWSGLLHRPYAVAVFAGTALVSVRYELAPALWDAWIWALLAFSAAVLVTRLARYTTLHRVVYVLALFYPAFLVLEALRPPPAVFRLALIVVAVCGALYFLLLFRQATARRVEAPTVRWPIVAGLAMWIVVLLAEVAGYYLLARWIIHATVTTAWVVFTVALSLVMVRGAIDTLLRTEAGGRLRFLRTVGVPLVERVLKVVQIVLVVVAVLNILDIWEIASSPVETWRQFTGLGFTLAGIQITIGRVIAAIVLVYLAVLASWTVRTFNASEVYPRWELERGVGDSINSLLHYLLITIGVIIGLGTVGVELQNFAIVAGALGVGIGFGLQNIVNNFVSGIILLFERPVRVGDTIVIEGELGLIKKIGLRSTTVVTFDFAEVIVPNGDLVSEKVTNWTLSNPTARLILPVGVAYGSDVPRVLEILREAASTHQAVLDDPEPQALFMEFGDSALEFELRVWVRELPLRLKVRSALLAEIDRRFREENIEIPFPQRDLHLRSMDPRVLESISRKGEERDRKEIQ
jgi:potassium-dependent mechanosensitive channel